MLSHFNINLNITLYIENDFQQNIFCDYFLLLIVIFIPENLLLSTEISSKIVIDYRYFIR